MRAVHAEAWSNDEVYYPIRLAWKKHRREDDDFGIVAPAPADTP
jgi:hypothetical protein